MFDLDCLSLYVETEILECFHFIVIFLLFCCDEITLTCNLISEQYCTSYPFRLVECAMNIR